MDNRLRRNEVCVIGLPRCDFVFASSRSCFIAYGFGTSDLEVSILRSLLEKQGIEAVEAGGMRSPGEHAFCVKICSKIITAQFCIVLLNNDIQDGQEVPNANVNMEYGLMLGFNKRVIPFQRNDQKLPFNVAALDTIKYSNEDFARLAGTAIDQAIAATTPSQIAPVDVNQRLNAYLLSRETSFSRVTDDGERAILDLGLPLGFNLLTDFAGTTYFFLGNYTFLRPETVAWRYKTLVRAIDGRRSSWEARIKLRVLTRKQATAADHIFSKFKIWLVVNTDDDKAAVNEALGKRHKYATEIVSLVDVERHLLSLGGMAS